MNHNTSTEKRRKNKLSTGHRLLILAASAVLCLMLAMPALSTRDDCKGYPVTLLTDKDYFPSLSKKIQEARKEIVIAIYLFKTNGFPASYTDIILGNLAKAKQRGVLVTVILEKDDRTDSFINDENAATAQRLKKAGVAVYFDNPGKMTHSKLAVIDKRFTFIGSHNLTQSALKYNNEFSVLIDSSDIALKTISYINNLRR